ncbi:MAG: hypothetical protein KA072_13120 [Thermoanaerobaculaceae bacterium]|nr:hypothetical protein [Thermoanaerobaculaceae bacterium]
MSNNAEFFGSTKALARNPLGIIALFIVLVYTVGSAVINFARAEFYQHPFHPAVLFLAVFPLVVLGAFTYLVARHHRNLYGPYDFDESKEFFYGMTVPAELKGESTGVATSDTTKRLIPHEDRTSIESKYKELVTGGFMLLHQAEVMRKRTSPKSGRYRVRVWVEAIESNRSITDIESVTYHVWHDFSNSVLSTSDAKSSFDLWLNIYGEFPVLALIKLRSGDEIEAHRYIDLPGRPPD